MSENLIFGADITSYGAVGDGKTDCSDAFIKAIQNGENLISVPFGTYIIKKGINLTSNVKLHIHSRAIIKYSPESKTDTPLFYGQDISSVIVIGGKFYADDTANSLFCFENSNSIKFSSVSIVKSTANAFVFDNCSEICVSHSSFNTENKDVFTFLGDCSNITIKDIEIKLACNAFQFGTKDKECNIKRFAVRNVVLHHVQSGFEFFKGLADDVIIENISGSFNWSFLRTFEGFSLSDTEFEKISVYCANRETGKYSNPAYLVIADSPCGLEINDFNRNVDLESVPFIPTMIFKATADSSAIIDGMALDHVISARGKSKTVGMTTAKLSNPCNKYIYTLECSINKDDTLTLPVGDFDYLSIYKK